MILPPRVLDDLGSFSEILKAGRVGVFSDFDGTLTPLFDDFRDTVLPPAIRDRLSELSRKVELVAVVSGRDVRYLRETIGLKSVTYVGNHGLEEWRAREKQPEYRAQVPVGLLEEVESGVGSIGISGLLVENKGLRVAVHYRNAPDLAAARSAVLQMLEPLAEGRGLGIKEGKMVWEIGPRVEVNKGTAVRRLAREYELTGAIVLGDDVTDCDAFDAVHGLVRERGIRGAAVVVVDEETPEAVLRKADYRLSGPGEVEEFLRWMAYVSSRAAEEAVAPVVGGVVAYVLVEGLPATLSLGFGHGQGTVDGGSRLLKVVRVDHESVMHGLCRAAKAGKDQDAGIGSLGGYELLGDQVHAVAERGDEAGVGLSVQQGEILLGIGSVQGVNGQPMDLSELAVDRADE